MSALMGNFSCPNPSCGKNFKWKKNLAYHLKYQCEKPPRYKCPYCEYASKWRKDVERHVQTMHPIEEVKVIEIGKAKEEIKFECTFICPRENCKKTFKTFNNLNYHIENTCKYMT